MVFEHLPQELEDAIEIGDCVIDQEKRVNFFIRNNADAQLKFAF